MKKHTTKREGLKKQNFMYIVCEDLSLVKG